MNEPALRQPGASAAQAQAPALTPAPVLAARGGREPLLIDCGSCAAGPTACGDCVVSFLLGAPELEADEVAALAVLADSGLVPPLRLLRAEPPPAS